MSKSLIAIGLLLIFFGVLLHYFPQALQRLGRLPGDIRWQSGQTSFYFPIVTCLVASMLLSLILWMVRK